MVYIVSDDGKERKYACMTCIRGHRSSKCSHNNRELFEIKKKGRPISQCDACRQLRRTKQMHVKCICHTKEKEKDSCESSPSSSTQQLPRLSQLNLEASKACMQCDQPQPSCVCAQSPSSIRANSHHHLEGHVSSSSSEGTITPPCDAHSTHPAGLGYASSPLLSANQADSPPMTINTTVLPIPSNHSSPTSTTSTNLYNKPNTTPTKKSHLVIPIHDPTDDMDSDTPIYKSEETVIPDQTAVLGELTHKSSEELMNQIYSGFIEHKDKPSCKFVNHQVNEFEEQQ